MKLCVSLISPLHLTFDMLIEYLKFQLYVFSSRSRRTRIRISRTPKARHPSRHIVILHPPSPLFSFPITLHLYHHPSFLRSVSLVNMFYDFGYTGGKIVWLVIIVHRLQLVTKNRTREPTYILYLRRCWG